ncbi:MAG: tetratricopeptide repeat protein [Chthoniobacterales bacterium]
MNNWKLLLALLPLVLASQANCLSASIVEPLASLEEQVQKNPDDNAAWNRIADAHLRLLSSTGQLSHLSLASEAVEKSLKIANPAFNKAALALRTRVELSSHHFAEARRSAEQLRELMQDGTYALQLLGDALFSLGDYAEAGAVWSKVPLPGNELAMEPRLSQLDWIHGNMAGARQRLEDTLPRAEKFASQFPDVPAWCHVQIGELAFRAGDWETAESHYQSALSQQPDYYSGLDHLAELRGAQGKVDEASALYLHLIERVDRPEFLQALGDLYLFAGKKEEAKVWHERALAGYLDSVKRGEPLYDHHLAGLYSDSLNQPEAAVQSARRDLAGRHSIQTYDALAWALFKAGKNAEALEFTSKALATGVLDAHILYHAGMIRMGSRDIPGGTAALQNAMKANARYSTFHVHR